MSAAIVIGGGIAGMSAAKVLAGFFDKVIVLERDRYPEGVEDRRGVPQCDKERGQYDDADEQRHILRPHVPRQPAEFEEDQVNQHNVENKYENHSTSPFFGYSKKCYHDCLPY